MPEEKEEKQFVPNPGTKVSKAYKWKYLLARNVAIGAVASFLLVSCILGWAIKKKSDLQDKLDKAKIVTIAPNGKVLTEPVK